MKYIELIIAIEFDEHMPALVVLTVVLILIGIAVGRAAENKKRKEP